MRKGLCMLALALTTTFCLVGCGESSHPATPSSNSTMLTVVIRDNVYSPNPLIVKVGMSVNWKNQDPVSHNAVATDFDSGTIPPQSADSVPVVMHQAGTFQYRCTLHGETASIIVQP
jgi:plastocyanin